MAHNAGRGEKTAKAAAGLGKGGETSELRLLRVLGI